MHPEVDAAVSHHRRPEQDGTTFPRAPSVQHAHHESRDREMVRGVRGDETVPPAAFAQHAHHSLKPVGVTRTKPMHCFLEQQHRSTVAAPDHEGQHRKRPPERALAPAAPHQREETAIEREPHDHVRCAQHHRIRPRRVRTVDRQEQFLVELNDAFDDDHHLQFFSALLCVFATLRLIGSVELFPDRVLQLVQAFTGNGADHHRIHAHGQFLLDRLLQFVVEQVALGDRQQAVLVQEFR